jgi:hypothetical protein
MAMPYFESDHFIGGGSVRSRQMPRSQSSVKHCALLKVHCGEPRPNSGVSSKCLRAPESRRRQWPSRSSRPKALERLSDAIKQLNALKDAVKDEAQSKIAAAVAAHAHVKAAQADWVAAQSEAKVAEAKAAPISVLISRKTQRLYAR